MAMMPSLVPDQFCDCASKSRGVWPKAFCITVSRTRESYLLSRISQIKKSRSLWQCGRHRYGWTGKICVTQCLKRARLSSMDERRTIRSSAMTPPGTFSQWANQPRMG